MGYTTILKDHNNPERSLPKALADLVGRNVQRPEVADNATNNISVGDNLFIPEAPNTLSVKGNEMVLGVLA